MSLKVAFLDGFLDGIFREEAPNSLGVDKISATCSLLPEISNISPQLTQRAFHRGSMEECKIGETSPASQRASQPKLSCIELSGYGPGELGLAGKNSRVKVVKIVGTRSQTAVQLGIKISSLPTIVSYLFKSSFP